LRPEFNFTCTHSHSHSIAHTSPFEFFIVQYLSDDASWAVLTLAKHSLSLFAMRTSRASQFYLACWFLLAPQAVHVQAEPQCAIDPNSIVSDACTSYAALDALNHDIAPSLDDLTTNTDFFAYYRLNLYNKVCPFWTDESSMCGNRACAVDTIEDEDDVPEIWRAEELSKLEGMKAKHPGRQQQKERPKQRPLQYQLGQHVDESCVFEDDDECDERDYCVPEDEGATAKGDYVSLVNNTERFTGYSGPGARQVWEAIYKENCFTSQTPPAASSSSNKYLVAQSLRNVFQEYGRAHLDNAPPDADEMFDPAALDDECIEQRAFYRIISGMHTSISTHLCYDYFNQTTGEWFRNTTCYRQRLHSHPERLSNLYFNYALVTRAIAKLRKHLEHYTFCSGDTEQDYSTKQKVLALADTISYAPNTFDESLLFQTDLSLKDDFKHRFRNVSRIMDCVGCDKCRLWGKVQTAGYGAALKVLFEFDETKNGENPHLRRTELVALVNTLGRIGHSLEALRWFRTAIAEEDAAMAVIGTQAAPNIPKHVEAEATSSNTVRAIPPSASSGHRASEALDDGIPVPDPLARRRRNRDHDPSLSEMFWEEWNLVWRAYRLVLHSWIEMPFKLWAISIMELNRLWNWFIGLPVPQRSWGIEWPTVPRRDEL
jgi:ERO1-like protein beta